MKIFLRQYLLLVYFSLVYTTTSVAQESINFSRCQIAVGALEIDAECGTLNRPEDPNHTDGKQISLFIAKLPSRSVNPEPDALTIIQGGPGGSSVDLGISYAKLLDPILAKRDVLLLDQRGTGRSNKLICPIAEEDKAALQFDAARIAEQTKKCLDSLSDHNLGFYTTSVAVQDLEAVRQAAGYPQLTLYGVSYGTRVAQHYLRRFPDSTRAVILDGVAHVDLNLAGGEIARRSQEAFDGMASRCQSNPACKARFGDLTEKFTTLRDRLAEAPVEISLAHPTTGKPVTEIVSKEHLYGVTRMLPYGTESLSLLPFTISEAYDGNYLPLASQAININDSFNDSFATGMHNSVLCTEDFPFVEASDTANLSATYFNDLMVKTIKITCELWPKGSLDQDFREPFKSDKPVLILSGETDPITPPDNGDKALAMFSNAVHIKVPAHGHGVLARGCMPALAKEFVVNADPQTLKVDCVNRERAMPFFVDSTGPRP